MKNDFFTFCQQCPGISHLGTGAFLATFIVMSSGRILAFMKPAFGCSPLPLNKVGGSITYPPTFSRTPSTIQ